ncbi:MAG: penicillin-binding protein 2 [Propionibacteriaceae bacterium]|jgi:cell division protein FtsI (penicillin-binding protein 3)|nr:penicillin-binding protein 2 [Propionibacteriaceae bacterium]
MVPPRYRQGVRQQAEATSRTKEAARRRARAAEEKARAERRAAAARRWEAPLGSPGRRLTIGLLVCAVIASLLGARALQLQGLDPGSNAAFALDETMRSPIIPATRGSVTDRNGELLISSEPAVNIVADPIIVASNGLDAATMGGMESLKAQAGPGIIAGLLAYYLGGDYNDYYTKLTTTADADGDAIHYTILGKNIRDYVDVQLNQELSQLAYVGLDEEQAPVRLYPQGTLAANVLGFMVYDADLDAQQKYPWSGGGGLELALDANLSGVDGREYYEASSYARIPTGSTVVEAAQDGISYELTLDAGLQYEVELLLKGAVQDHAASSGTAIVMDVTTGEILVMATYPTFDPNDIAAADPENLGNRALTQVYEPGSVQKVLTMAALLDTGLVTPDKQMVVPGCIQSGGKSLCDDWSHGDAQWTATGILAMSSNVGMALMTREMEAGTLSQYLASFGFGQLTGLDWPGEQTGDLPGADMTNQTRDQIAFGQGLSVTAVQEAAAIAAVVNGGVYHSPQLIKQAWTSDGQPYPVPTQVTRQVISPESSATLVSMMEAAIVTNNKGIAGYREIGKTGTADRYNADCACYRGVVGSFVGVAPAENPQILVYVALDDPTNQQYGSQVAQPTAEDIMKLALPRYGVAPSTTAAPEFTTTW